MSARAPASPAWRWTDSALVGAAVVIPLVVYLRTLAPTVALGDSGELTAAAYALGIPHAPGYPLYMLLLHAWQWLPVASVAYRSNLFSAVAMAAMCGVMAANYRRAGGARPGALLAALVPAFLSICWSEATRAEVYSLETLLVAISVGVFLHWQRARTPRSLVAFALTVGLAVSHHATSSLLLAPFLVAALLGHRPWSLGQAVKVAAALAAPYLLYFYLPIRAAAHPPLNAGDIRTWGDVLNHVINRRGGNWLGMRPPGQWVTFFVNGTLLVPGAQMSAVGAGLIVLGAAAAIVKHRVAGLCAAIGVFTLAAWASAWGWGEPKWFVAALMFHGVWLAAGAETAAAGVRRLGESRPMRTLAGMIPIAALIAFPGLLLANNWAREDLSRQWDPYDWGRILTAEVAPGALVGLSPDSPYGISHYFRIVEGARPDVLFFCPNLIGEPWAIRQLPDARMRLVAQQAIYTLRPGTPLPAHVMRTLASYYAATRPLYYDLALPGLPPPLRIVEQQTVNRIVADGPDFLRPCPEGEAALVDFARGLGLNGTGRNLALVRVEVAQPRLAPGALVRATFWWRCRAPVRERLTLASSLLRDGAPWAEAAPLFTGGSVPVVYGRVPLPASPAGACYEQGVWYVVPRHLAPGRYGLYVQLAGEKETSAAVRVAAVEVAR